MSDILSNVSAEILAWPVIFLLGWLGSNLYHWLTRGKREKRLHHNTEIALQCVVEAEEAITVSKSGARKLQHAIVLYMDRTGANYEEARNEILLAFSVSDLRRNG
ncbi:MAG: hypothetical protein ABH814_00025 [bacterium]